MGRYLDGKTNTTKALKG